MRGSGGYNRFPRERRKPPRSVSVARKVDTPQPMFQDFLNDAGAALVDRRISIRTITSTHVTFLQARSIRDALRATFPEPAGVNRFSYWLRGQLVPFNAQNISAAVDPQLPLKIIGDHRNKLVLNLIEDDRLHLERERIERLLTGEFNDVLELEAFDPHITLGKVVLQELSRRERKNPSLLIPEVAIPETVALDGLTVFLGETGLSL